ncbi:hypothetical protein BsIDN1_22310 [Bacillus safensis]|uniref:Uncharacterized protein n=1 Tax=Bacillus safensis TaxID=561879 RepID=A0A5S9M662_BACIA|nr:hypothetical protein BsIDN1_22310 [Bacillus safensis]
MQREQIFPYKGQAKWSKDLLSVRFTPSSDWIMLIMEATEVMIGRKFKAAKNKAAK